jgi:hypothetical protein
MINETDQYIPGNNIGLASRDSGNCLGLGNRGSRIQ